MTRLEARNDHSGEVGTNTVSIVGERGVHLRHLQLVVEVADGAQALHDRDDVALLAERGEQAAEAVDLDVGEVARRPRVSIAMRSSAEKRRLLDLFTPTATTTSSKSCEALETMSRCPLVTGSNDPGQTALRTGVYSWGAE